MSLDQELIKVRQKIGNSFLRAFYPIDYRSNQNVLKNIDQLLERETKGLRTLSSTTSMMSDKLARTLNGMAQDMEELQNGLESLVATSSTSDEILKARLERIEESSFNLSNILGAMGLAGELIRRRSGSRGKNKKPRVKKPPGKTKTPEAKTPEKGKAPETKAPEKGKGTAEEARGSKGKAGGKIGVRSANILLAAYTLWQMWQEIQALDPNMKKGAYRQALMQIVGRTVAEVGLAWVGAFVAATVAGALTGGLGAIPGFLVGLAGGAAAQWAFGDSVDQVVDYIIDYLYTGDEEEEAAAASGDATIQNREAQAPTPALETPEQTAAAGGEQVAVAAAVQAPVPPTPPLPQTVDAPVEWPIAPPPTEMDFFPSQQSQVSTVPSSQVNIQSNLPESMRSIPQTPEEQQDFMRRMNVGGNDQYIGGNQNDTTAQIDIYGGMDADPGLGTITTSTGMTTQVAAQLVPNFQGFVNALEATGYRIKSIGGYADRNIKGKNKKSFHASGAAIDINPGTNPHLFGGAMQTDMPENVAAIAKQFGLGWGGRWSSSTDTMHFSAASSEGGSFRVDRNTGAITPLAEGGKINPQKGGTLALIAEAGEPEYVVPQSKAIKFAHEMIAARPSIRTKKHTHVLVVPILT